MRVARARGRRDDRAGDRARPRPSRRRSTRSCCSTSTGRAPSAVATPTAAARREAAASTPSARRPRCTRARGLRRARQLGLLPGQPRRDARLPGGGLPLRRPRRPVLDDRAPARARPASSSEAGLLAVLGIGSAPGKTNLMARAGRCRELGRRASSRDAMSSRPGGTSTRRRASASPYALRTLIDELTMRAGRDPRRRGRGDRAAEPRRRGGLRRADRRGRDDLHAALRDAHLRRQLRLPRGQLPAVAAAGAARATARARRRAREEIEPRPPQAVPPSARHGRGSHGRGDATGRAVRVRAVDPAASSVGPRRRRSSRRPRRRRRRCGCWRAARSTRAARCPGALHRPRRPLRRARAAGLRASTVKIAEEVAA